MYEQYFKECLYNPKVSVMIKIIIFLNILLQIGIFSRYKPKVITETKLTKIKETDIIQITNRTIDFQPTYLSEYNMVKFIAYDNVDFNTMWIYDIFKNKYFNISNLTYAYSENIKE